MKKIDIDILINELNKLKRRGKTYIDYKGKFYDAKTDEKIHSLETIFNEFSEEYYYSK